LGLYTASVFSLIFHSRRSLRSTTFLLVRKVGSEHKRNVVDLNDLLEWNIKENTEAGV
jgi:hypothetical protein